MDKEGFTAYLEGKDHAPITAARYIKVVERFFGWIKISEEQITKPDVLRYLEHLKNKGFQNATRQNHLFALNHYFTFLYQTGQLLSNPCIFLKIRGTNKKKLHKIYTFEELQQIFDNYRQLFVHGNDPSPYRSLYAALCSERNVAILGVLIYQGVITSEIERIQIQDLDLMKATIKIRGGRYGMERIFPLKAEQIGMLLHYLQNTRPQLEQYHTTETGKLFLALGKKETGNGGLDGALKTISKNIKSIDQHFVNFGQIRASVISFLIKTQGLRKAQYLAGHRHIFSTEGYLSNDLDELTDDINQLHPF